MATAQVTMPVLVRVGGKDIEVGTLTVDVKVSPSGRISTPTAREVKAALRKGVR